jgi:3-deoxy-D-manno-octulosonic acid kinase
MPDPKPAHWHSGAHHVLHDPAAMPQPRVELFDPAYWQTIGRSDGNAVGRGWVTFVRGGPRDEPWALRHYRRGGYAAKMVRDSYLWLGLEATRPWREYRLTAELHAKGLPVPRVVAAHVERRGLGYRGDLITARIAPADTLADVLAKRPIHAAHWTALGKTLRQFHDAGARHDDINARNILLDGKHQFWLIDFDKAALLPSGPWQAQNLARFQRSLEKFRGATPGFNYTDSDWQALVNGYVSSRGA